MNYLTAVLILALGVNLNEAKSQVRLTSPFSILATDNNETVRAETALVAESLKKLVTKQVRQTHSRSFLGVITVKDLVNEIIGVTASTASIAIPAPGASETIAILLLTYNWALYKEINANASLTSISAMAIDKLVSDKVMYNVIEPLAKVYEQLGKNVRGLAEVRQLYLPTSLFAEVIPWFEIPDLKIFVFLIVLKIYSDERNQDFQHHKNLS